MLLGRAALLDPLGVGQEGGPLRRSARMQTDPDHPLGCLVVLSATTCSPDDRQLHALLAAERDRNRDGLRDCVVRRAIARGELPPDIDPVGLAALFDTLLVGPSVQARDGVPLAALEAATRLLYVWDGLAAASADGP